MTTTGAGRDRQSAAAVFSLLPRESFCGRRRWVGGAATDGVGGGDGRGIVRLRGCYYGMLKVGILVFRRGRMLCIGRRCHRQLLCNHILCYWSKC